MAPSGSTAQNVVPVQGLSKICIRCNQVKEESFFVKRGELYKSWCRECENIRRRIQYQEQQEYRTSKARENYSKNPIRQLTASQKWREKYPEHYSAYLHSWYKNNPDAIKRNRIRRNARARNAGLFKITTKEILKLKAQSCFYCGSKRNIEIDHRVPVSRGGSHSIGNLVSACRKCNRSKSSKFITEWNIFKRKLNNAR